MGRRAMGWKLRLKRLVAVGKEKREKQSVLAILELPGDVIDDILSRLPGKDLLRFRCVSKRCRALIDSLMFTKILFILSRLPVEDLLRLRCVSRRSRALIDSRIFIKLQLNQSLQNRTNLSLVSRDENKLYSVDYDKIDGWVAFSDVVEDVVEVDHPMKSLDRWTRVECSCNGLFCLRSLLYGDEGEDETIETITLLNPSTKEYRILPPVPYGGALHTFHGIVYDPVGDDYKVIRVVQFHSHSLTSSQVMVYGLRSNVWRRGCESFNYSLYLPFPTSERYPGVLLNGALHWLARRDRFDLFDIVVALDPMDEQHLEVRVPSVSSIYYGTLGVLGGCLCILYAFMHEEDPAEVWVMNDYMVESSWTKLCRVVMPNFKDSVAYMVLVSARVLGYSTRSRDVILLQMFGNLMWYDLKERSAEYVDLISFGADVNVKSLVNLSHYQ